MDALRVELRPLSGDARLAMRYEHPSLRLELSDRPAASTEAMEAARETMALVLGRPLRAGEEPSVLPARHGLRLFGAAHDITYRSESRLIVGIDFLVPKEAWSVVVPFPKWPRILGRTALALSAETAEADGDDLSDIPVTVRSDEARSQVLIDLAYDASRGRAYEVADDCVAVVEEGRVTAFFGRFSADSLPRS